MAFTGENARAFWNHLNSSVINNPALNARQKMAHFVSRVKEQKDAAALVAGFPPDGSELTSMVTMGRRRRTSTRARVPGVKVTSSVVSP